MRGVNILISCNQGVNTMDDLFPILKFLFSITIVFFLTFCSIRIYQNTDQINQTCENLEEHISDLSQNLLVQNNRK